jgi:hypothetical protein
VQASRFTRVRSRPLRIVDKKYSVPERESRLL